MKDASWAGVVVYINNTNQYMEEEAGGHGIQGHPQLHSEFEISLAYIKSCLNKTKQNNKGCINPKMTLTLILVYMLIYFMPIMDNYICYIYQYKNLSIMMKSYSKVEKNAMIS